MHDGLIQIRALREIKENELRSIHNIVARYKGGSEIEYLHRKRGFDIYVSHVVDARHITSKILKVLGGELKTSSTFLRVENGRAIYRYTFRIKLPDQPSRARYGF